MVVVFPARSATTGTTPSATAKITNTGRRTGSLCAIQMKATQPSWTIKMPMA